MHNPILFLHFTLTRHLPPSIPNESSVSHLQSRAAYTAANQLASRRHGERAPRGIPCGHRHANTTQTEPGSLEFLHYPSSPTSYHPLPCHLPSPLLLNIEQGDGVGVSQQQVPGARVEDFIAVWHLHFFSDLILQIFN